MDSFKSIAELQKANKEWELEAQRRADAARLKSAQEAMAEQTRAARMAATGLNATAVVDAAEQTGAHVDSDPIFELQLTVIVPGRPPYPATVRQIVSLPYLEKVQLGANLVAKVDPGDSRFIWIDLAGS